MLKATCTLVYDPHNDAASRKGLQSWWLKADVHQSISQYYRYWLQRELGIKLNTPLWKSHITIIRGETPRNQSLWRKHNGRRFEFSYDPQVRVSETYAWLSVESKELENVRVELGLRPQPRVNFHLTLGNTKNLPQTTVEPIQLPFRVFPWERPEVLDVLRRK